MMSYYIEFNSDTKWKNAYRRNNKGKDSKHILCFPDHSIIGHRPNEFCGRSIRINTICPNSRKILVCGNFCPLDEDILFCHVNDIISHSMLNNFNSNCQCPLYLGEEVDPFRTYELNSMHRSWVMNMPLTKSPKQFMFCVYLLIESNEIDNYICVASIQSPPFIILSARRNCINEDYQVEIPKIPMSLQPPFSPVNYSDETNNLKTSESSYMIKSKNDPNSFKFDDLMPHIYDEDKLQLNIINSNNTSSYDENNNKVVELTVESVEGMKKTMSSLAYTQPNTIYKVNTRRGQVEMRVIDQIHCNKKRDEIAFHGETIDDLNSKSGEFEYLDSFGNRCVIQPGCYLEEDKV